MHKADDDVWVGRLERGQAPGRPFAAVPDVVRLVGQRQRAQVLGMLRIASRPHQCRSQRLELFTCNATRQHATHGYKPSCTQLQLGKLGAA